MSFVGTFGSFTVARLGIYAAQKGLSVTGNNISNINTRGYTRQSLDQISLRIGGADRYQSQMDCRVGTGVLPVGVSQIRDPYLDIRYRHEMASVGAADGKLAGLEQIASVLDEVAKGGDENGLIEAQLSDLLDTLQNLSVNTGQDEAQIQVRTSAEALVKLFNSYAQRLEDEKDNAEKSFAQDIKDVNNILESIRDLNSTIRKSEIHGDSALELRDERNRLIDQLSQYMKIDVVYSMEDVGGGQMVEKLTIKLGNANPDPTKPNDTATLVDGTYATQLSLTQIPKPNPDYDPTDPNSFKYLKPDGAGTNLIDEAAMIDSPNYDLTLAELKDAKDRLLKHVSVGPNEIFHAAPPVDLNDPNQNPVIDDSVPGTIVSTLYSIGKNANGQDVYYKQVTTTTFSQPVDLDDNDLYGSLQSARELLTEKGEFSNADDIVRDSKASVKRGIPYYQKSLDLLANKIATVFNQANKGNLVDKNGIDTGVPADFSGNLFAPQTGKGPITAANISISQRWASGEVKIVTSFKEDAGSTANDNVLHMISLMGEKMDYDPTRVAADSVSNKLFKGTFQEMLTNIGTVLGNDQRSTTILLETYHTSSIELDTSRDSVSGVDLNDEAAGLMQYQKSYAAACRLMTTLDEVLDKLINGTGIAGR